MSDCAGVALWASWTEKRREMAHRKKNTALRQDVEVVEVAPSENSETPPQDAKKDEEQLCLRKGPRAKEFGKRAKRPKKRAYL